jgi:beta-lactamase class C
MFKKLLLSAVLLTSLPIYANVASNEAIVKQAVDAMMKKDHTPGVAVLLYVDGKPYSYYAGVANQEKKTPITQKTIFELGSLSKLYTSLLLAQAVDAATLQLNDAMTDFLPNASDELGDITLLNLATHTSGLPFEVPTTVRSTETLNAYLASYSSDTVADQTWLYSNVGFGLLGLTIEAKTHKNINQLYISQILQPLKMQPIGSVIPQKLRSYYATGYGLDNKPIPHDESGLLASAWAVKASPSDMQKFLSAAIGLPGTPERILYPMRLTQSSFVTLEDKNQGLGWMIHDVADDPVTTDLEPATVDKITKSGIYNGDKLIDKTGGTEGFRAYIAVIPNKNTGIVLLTNQATAMADIVETAHAILYQVNGIKENDEENIR